MLFFRICHSMAVRQQFPIWLPMKREGNTHSLLSIMVVLGGQLVSCCMEGKWTPPIPGDMRMACFSVVIFMAKSIMQSVIPRGVGGEIVLAHAS